MSRRTTKARTIVCILFETFYSFPIIEVVVSGLLFLSVYFMANASLSNTFRLVPAPGSPFVGVFLDIIEQSVINALCVSLLNLSSLLALLIPLLVAFSFARLIETGLLRTYLSYPIGRCSTLVLSVLLVLAVVVAPITLGLTLSVYIFNPYFPPVDSFVLAATALCLFTLLTVSLTLLLSLLSKSVLATSIGGVGLSYAMLGAGAYYEAPAYAVAAINPLEFTVRYLTGNGPPTDLGGVLLGLSGSVLIIVLALVLCVFTVQRMEV